MQRQRHESGDTGTGSGSQWIVDGDVAVVNAQRCGEQRVEAQEWDAGRRASENRAGSAAPKSAGLRFENSCVREPRVVTLDDDVHVIFQRYNPWFADTGILKAK